MNLRIIFTAFILIFLVGCSYYSKRGYKIGEIEEGIIVDGSTQIGTASWYGNEEHNRKTASGERFNKFAYTAAHKTLPFGTMVRVTNLENGRDVLVKINDRGPFIRGRVIDLSYESAKSIGLIRTGTAKVKIEVVASASNRKSSYFKPLYTVQVGSFSSKVNAFIVQKDLKSTLKDKVRIEPVDIRGDTYYRVRVGMFHKKSDAEHLKRSIHKYGYRGKVILE